jgi:hypothetical protein
MKWMTIVILSLWMSVSFAGDEHEMAQIDTCYHWLEEDKLASKLNYAKDNRGQMEFYDGKPIYCWRSPLGAYSKWEDHGNVLIRIKLKPGIKVVNDVRKNTTDEMENAHEPVIYSNDNRWHEYTLAPSSIESWSIYEPRMANEMIAELQFYQLGLVTANDVFYPFEQYDLNYAMTNLTPVIQQHRHKAAQAHIFGAHPERHFTTQYKFPWMKLLKKDGGVKILSAAEAGALKDDEVPVQIKIIEASYGLNLSKKNKGNATAKAAEFCDTKNPCTYKVSPRFIEDPDSSKEKSFEISWRCTGKNKNIMHKKFDAPADDKVFQMSCP